MRTRLVDWLYPGKGGQGGRVLGVMVLENTTEWFFAQQAENDDGINTVMLHVDGTLRFPGKNEKLSSSKSAFIWL